MHARLVTPARALDPEYWRSLCPELHVGDEAFTESVRAMSDVGSGDGFAQDVRARIIERGFTKIPSHALPWRTTNHRALARAAMRLMQHGWNPTWLLVYDEAWAVARELSAFVFETTGNRLNHDALLWHVGVHDAAPTAFSPHRDRQPDDARSTFREDGTAMYATAWVPLTDAGPENSCLCFVPAPDDPGYVNGDDDGDGGDDGDDGGDDGDDGGDGAATDEDDGREGAFGSAEKPPRETDPLRLALPNKEAYQRIASVPAEAGSVVVFTHRVIHWGSAPPPPTPPSYGETHEPRVCVSFGFADEEYEPAYLRRGDGGRDDAPFPRLRARVALVAAQMVSYHERFACDAKTLGLFHALIMGCGSERANESGASASKAVATESANRAFFLCPKYKRGVLREYVRAAAELGAEKASAVERERERGDDLDDDGDDSDAVEDVMDNALEAMLEAQMAGRIDEFEDDFDAIAAEEATRCSRKKRRR